MNAEVAIVGAGPSGCAAAIELARAGARVLLLEKSSFPRNKVCGEFLSPEVAGVLEELGCAGVLGPAARIESGRVVMRSGCVLDFAFPGPAYGLSRRTLDATLACHARAAGAALVEKTEVADIENDGGRPTLVSRDGRRFVARAVLLACGRHSLLHARRAARQDCFGFKAHFRGSWAARLDLHFFDGGYLGVAPVEDGKINVCALVEKRLLKDPDALVKRVLGKELKRDGDFLFTGPLRPGWQKGLRTGMLSAGDAAVFVDPFTGDGIALALRSGRLAARHVLRQLEGRDPRRVSADYAHDLQRLCGRQMAAARLVRWGSSLPLLEAPLARLLASSPGLRRAIFRITRGSLATSELFARE